MPDLFQRWLWATLRDEEAPSWDAWPPRFSSDSGPNWPQPLARASPTVVASGGPYTEVAASGCRKPQSGSLAGFTLAVKGLISIAGVPNRAGSRARSEVEPEPENAPVVNALLSAGARFVGVTAMHELALGATGVNEYEGTPGNPWDPTRIPGGSSSGSAVAVAEGSARIALGTDTGGSVRIPAALCGVVGFKPTYGRYPMDGTVPLAPSLDHLGVLTRTVDDAARVHAAITGELIGAATSPIRLVYSDADANLASPAVKARFHEATRRLVAAGVAITEVESPSLALVFAASTGILLSEAAGVHSSTLRSRRELLGTDVRERLDTGAALPQEIYRAAVAARAAIRAQVDAMLDRFTLWIGPTVGEVAPRVDSVDDPTLGTRLVTHTRLANLVGLPAISIPLPGQGLPIGLQVVGKTDTDVLAAAAWIADTLHA